MYMIFFILMIIAVILLVVFNVNALKRRQNDSDVEVPKTDQLNDSAQVHELEPDYSHKDSIRAAAPQLELRETTRKEHSDADFRQALLKLSGHEQPTELPDNPKKEPTLKSTDDAYREALRSMSKPDKQKEK
jgi:hypothetical protein